MPGRLQVLAGRADNAVSGRWDTEVKLNAGT